MLVDLLPPFEWHEPEISQWTGGASLNRLELKVLYQHDRAVMGSDLTVGLEDAGDLTAAPCKITQLLGLTVPRGAIADIIGAQRDTTLVRCHYNLLVADFVQKSVMDEFGFSELSLGWRTRPVLAIRGGYPQTHFGDELSRFEAVNSGDTSVAVSTKVQPNAAEVRDLELTGLKGLLEALRPGEDLTLLVGIEDQFTVYSNDYTFSMQARSGWILEKAQLML